MFPTTRSAISSTDHSIVAAPTATMEWAVEEIAKRVVGDMAG